MVVTEEIVKCWMCSDRPITHCLITSTLREGYDQHPLCEQCATKIDESYPYGWMNYAEMYFKECVFILSIV